MNKVHFAALFYQDFIQKSFILRINLEVQFNNFFIKREFMFIEKKAKENLLPHHCENAMNQDLTGHKSSAKS